MTPQASEQGDSVFALVQQHAKNGTWSQLASELDLMPRGGLDADGEIAWFRGRGLAAERLGHDDEALSLYEAGLAKHSASSWLAFLAGQIHERAGSVDVARSHLASVRLKDGDGALLLAAVRYLYLWNDWVNAIGLLDQLFVAYFKLPSADTMFLWLRKLPGFEETFAGRAAVAALSDRLEDAEEILRRADAQLDDVHSERLWLTIEATRGSPAGLYRYLATAVSESPTQLLTGHTRMQEAVWLSRTDGSLDDGLARLAGVKLQPNDHRWLGDVRLVARCSLLRRFNDPRLAEEIDTVFARQPLLFEPWHAFDFGLLDEQEDLKALYRAKRTGHRDP